MYESMLSRILETGAKMCSCRICCEDENGKVFEIKNTAEVKKMSSKETWLSFSPLRKNTGSSPMNGGKLFEQSLFSKHRFPLDLPCEDIFLIFDILDECSLVATDDAQYHYIIHNDSLCHKQDCKRDFEYARTLFITADRYVEWEYYKDALSLMYNVAVRMSDVYKNLKKDNTELLHAIQKFREDLRLMYKQVRNKGVVPMKRKILFALFFLNMSLFSTVRAVLH